MNATDAIEFMLAGSSAVQIGTGIFKNPDIFNQTIEGINEYLDRHKIQSVSELIGGLQM